MPVTRLALNPDELIYSWFARHAYAAGNHRTNGEPHRGLAVSPPGSRGLAFGLAALKGSQPELGSTQKLALSHSQLGYLTAFKPPILRLIAVQEALSVAPNWARIVGPHTLRGVMPTLRHCPECDQASLNANGFTYWRVAHQLPCAWVCDVHATPLYEVVESETQSCWALPGDQRNACIGVGLSDQALSSASRISLIAKSICDWANPHAIPPGDVTELLRRGVMLRAGAQSVTSTRCLINELADALLQLLVDLPRSRELQTIANSPGRLRDQIQPLFDSRGGTSGPLIRHLLIAALFRSWEDVEAAMSLSTPASPVLRGRGRPRTRETTKSENLTQAALWDE